MHTLCRMVRISGILLTAIMTLVAGLPHFSCVCPDGNVKPFCFGTSSAKSGCCCNGACCSSSEGVASCCCAHSRGPAGNAISASCCQQQGKESSWSHSNRHQVGRSGCTKTLASSLLVILPRAETVGDEDL